MIQLNIGDHVSPQAGFVEIPNRNRATARWARTRAVWVSKNKPAADTYYATMPGGKTLTQLLADSTIWVNYEQSPLYGHAVVGGKELAISNRSFAMGRWTVLATLVHELAHINGAPASNASTMAELAVLHCGLGKPSELTSGTDDPRTPFNPTFGG